jgi:hypothetical protein
MSTQSDPARAGVKAGRVVGLLTAILVVVSLLRVEESFVGRLVTLVELFGIDPRGSVQLYFIIYVIGAAAGRYALCYIVGSLIGVVYDWLEQPSVAVLAAMVLAVGLVDGIGAAIDTRSPLIGAGYVLAWCCYLPAFTRLGGDEPSEESKPKRFHDP